ncbi:HAMP domain-containing sensor histidine kinase [Massilia sp.]|uniref:sensor histidine kinase n=1 Tax=Massilia sp. TaxID=1882437 RepID=UPI0028B031BD|nr:HAMP domain-containing sensor histidine kinase [Massilia sp.]
MGRRTDRPTGRLFWKFFLSILLAQVAAAVGIGSVFWLREQARLSNTITLIETGPPAGFMLDSAAIALKYGGVPALREIVSQKGRHSVYAVFSDGRELLGREVTPSMREQARRELATERPYRPVRQLKAPDGQQLLLFVPRMYRNAAGDTLTAAQVAGPGPGAEGPPAGMDAPGPGEARAGGMPGPNGPGGPDDRSGFGRGDGPRGPFGPFSPMGRPIPMLAAIIVSLFFAALLAWYFSRPIRALRSAFEAASAGDLSPRFTDGDRLGGDELNDLGRDFDRMSGQLRALMDGQRRLLHDVSHELRSPLARLQAAIGLAHQQPDKIATSLERIERESVRMDKLVGELLALSRLEANPDLPKSDAIDMQELVDGISQDARFEAGDDGPAIEVDIDGELVANVRGAPDLLWRAVENVVRNAVKHGGAGGQVDIRLYARGRQVYVDVLDRGPGILDADLPTVFEPFFRSNPSKNNVDGHGLGLAIAQRVVHAHGGTIEARNREGGGLQVAITLPLAP